LSFLAQRGVVSATACARNEAAGATLHVIDDDIAALGGQDPAPGAVESAGLRNVEIATLLSRELLQPEPSRPTTKVAERSSAARCHEK
jgi:hypothetical protein